MIRNAVFAWTIGLLVWSSGAMPQSPQPRAYADIFGMTIRQLTLPEASLLGLEEGVQVIAVAPDSEAARAGITPADTIATVNGATVKTVSELFDRLEGTPGTLRIQARSSGGYKRLEIPRPKVTGLIVFQSQRTGKGDLYRINADGTGMKRLTAGAEAEANPAWSPDGRQILYNAAAPGVHFNLALWVMNADGTGAKRLSNNVFAKTLPRWSPDGKFIYYLSDQNGKWDLWRMRQDGARAEALVECSPRLDVMAWTYPAFDVSPDGSFVVFPRYREGSFELGVLHVATRTMFPLTADVARPLRPQWNRTRNKVVVSSGNTFYIIDMTHNTAAPLSLANFATTDVASIVWSPNGDFFIVTARPSANEALQLYLVSTDGRLRRRITFHAADDNFADWTEGPQPKQAARK